jgi:hypothetical protein
VTHPRPATYQHHQSDDLVRPLRRTRPRHISEILRDDGWLLEAQHEPLDGFASGFKIGHALGLEPGLSVVRRSWPSGLRRPQWRSGGPSRPVVILVQSFQDKAGRRPGGLPLLSVAGRALSRKERQPCL